MKKIAFIDELGGDKCLFENESYRNRDGSTIAWSYLKESLKKNSIEIIFGVKYLSIADIIIELNITGFNNKPEKSILIITEPLVINSKNFDLNLLNKYKKIISVFDFHINKFHATKLYYPGIISNYIKLENFESNIDRKKKVIFIGSNYLSNKESLYRARNKIVTQGDKFSSLDVFGKFWTNLFPPIIDGDWKINKIRRILSTLISKKSLNKTIDNKSEVLKNYSYMLCIENSKVDGYITEKIFDAMMYGCVPIYIGSETINKYIPKNLFINASDISVDEFWIKLKLLDDLQIKKTRYEIYNYLVSKKSDIFKKEHFSSTIIDCINKFNSY